MRLSAQLPSSLRLTSVETELYLRLRDDLVDDALHQYAGFRHDGPRQLREPLVSVGSSPSPSPSPSHGGRQTHLPTGGICDYVDTRRWKLLRKQGELAVFKDRHAGREGHPLLRQIGQNGGGEPLITKCPVPRLLMVGTLRGSLEDSMYGGLVQSDHDLRLRSSYLRDDLDDIKLLHRLEGPTPEDPFRFTGLVWFAYGNKSVPFVRQRDTVLLLSTGVVTTRTGERLGFHVMHSVRLADVPTYDHLRYVRAHGSLCMLKRQVESDRLELFQKGFFAPMGDLPELAIVGSVVRSLLTTCNTVEAALSKKLHWMVLQAHGNQPRPRGNDNRHHVFQDGEAEDGAEDCAGACPKRRFRSARHKGRCMVCDKPVCGTCRVQREITVEVTPTMTLQRPLGFCRLCVERARRLSGRTVAIRELEEQERLRRYELEMQPKRAELVDVGDLGDLHSFDSASTECEEM